MEGDQAEVQRLAQDRRPGFKWTRVNQEAPQTHQNPLELTSTSNQTTVHILYQSSRFGVVNGHPSTSKGQCIMDYRHPLKGHSLDSLPNLVGGLVM